MDVVYNHTAGVRARTRKSVLDRIVPGYYQRLVADRPGGDTRPAAPNTATEHAMMGKLIVDSVAAPGRGSTRSTASAST